MTNEIWHQKLWRLFPQFYYCHFFVAFATILVTVRSPGFHKWSVWIEEVIFVLWTLEYVYFTVFHNLSTFKPAPNHFGVKRIRHVDTPEFWVIDVHFQLLYVKVFFLSPFLYFPPKELLLSRRKLPVAWINDLGRQFFLLTEKLHLNEQKPSASVSSVVCCCVFHSLLLFAVETLSSLPTVWHH